MRTGAVRIGCGLGTLLTSGQPSSVLRTFACLFLFISTLGVYAHFAQAQLVGKDVAVVPLLALGRIIQVHSGCSSIFRCSCVRLCYQCHTDIISVSCSVGKGHGCHFYSLPTSLPFSHFYFSVQMLEYIGLYL